MFWEDSVPTPRIIWFKFVFDCGGVGMVHIVTSTCKILHIQYQVTIISSTGLNHPNLKWFCTHHRGLGLQLCQINLDIYCLHKMKKHVFWLFIVSNHSRLFLILYCRFWSGQLKMDFAFFWPSVVHCIMLYQSKMLSQDVHPHIFLEVRQ